MKKKRYKHPIITVVKLDPDQAMLTACTSGGAYFTRNGRGCWDTGGHANCSLAVKGRARGINTGPTPTQPSAQPS